MARGTAVRRMKTRAASKTNNYMNMIEAALASLGDRNGSSRCKIARFIASYYKADTKGLQVALKRGVRAGRFVQQNGVFKLRAARRTATPKRRAALRKRAVRARRVSAARKARKSRSKKTRKSKSNKTRKSTSNKRRSRSTKRSSRKNAVSRRPRKVVNRVAKKSRANRRRVAAKNVMEKSRVTRSLLDVISERVIPRRAASDARRQIKGCF